MVPSRSREKSVTHRGKVLPTHLRPVSAERYGVSAWSATAAITTRAEDGTEARFFVKYAAGDHGSAQLQGEYRSMQEISTAVPGFTPKVFTYGKLKEAPAPTFFFLCQFVDITADLPDPKTLASQLAKLHRQSQSPTGKFGFDVPTYDGKLPQDTDWESSWTTFFSRLLAGIARLDVEVNGPWEQLQRETERTLKEVIPRLLGALEADGRKIKPCLIHGDLWEGNIGTDIQTGNLYIFDAASYYAHNEMELGIWRTDHHRMKSKVYKAEYLRAFEATDTVYEWNS